jgi:hypothetical protein
VYAVPDVSTGAPAHIAGKPLTIQKTTPAGDAPGAQTPAAAAPAPPAAAAPAAAPAATAVGRLTQIRATARITLARARHGGIQASFVVPTGAQVVRVRLAHRTSTAYLKFLAAGKPGTRQTVRLEGASLARKLRRGAYALSVSVGPGRTRLGAAITSTVTVR